MPLPKCLRLKAVRDVTGMATSTIYDQMSKGSFPRPIKLTGKAVAWLESDIAEWMESRERAA